MNKNMSKTPHVVDGEASESEAEEIQIKKRDTPQMDMKGSVVMGEAPESDDEPIMPALNIKKEPGLEDMDDEEPDSQDMDDEEEHWSQRKIKREPGTPRVKREPGSQRVKKEPNSPRVKREPRAQRVKTEPGQKVKKEGHKVKKEPGHKVKKEPGAQRVKRQPGAPRLIKKDFLSQGTSSTNPPPSEDSVLHQKLWECNVSLRASLEGLLHHTADIASDKLTASDMTLLKVQESMRATNANLTLARARLQRLHHELRKASCIMNMHTVKI